MAGLQWCENLHPLPAGARFSSPTRPAIVAIRHAHLHSNSGRAAYGVLGADGVKPALDQTFDFSDHPREGAPFPTPPRRGSPQVDHCSLKSRRLASSTAYQSAPSVSGRSAVAVGAGWPDETDPMTGLRGDSSAGRGQDPTRPYRPRRQWMMMNVSTVIEAIVARIVVPVICWLGL